MSFQPLIDELQAIFPDAVIGIDFLDDGGSILVDRLGECDIEHWGEDFDEKTLDDAIEKIRVTRDR